MLSRVRRAISDSGGWILDIRLFSNVSVCLRFEIPFDLVKRLREELEASGLVLSGKSPDGHSDFTADGSEAHEDIAGSLQITFVHSEPDLKIEVPAIPG